MTSIVIIGWYGTETIGDRAILAGLINTFAKTYDEFIINLGSLYPDFSERTLIEDGEFYSQISNSQLKDICIFDSMSKTVLRDAIKAADLVVVGGGPLMDIAEMHMLRYAFRFARKSKVRTALLGCGWGPLNKEEYIKCAVDLVNLADVAIFRDSISREQCLKYAPSADIVAAIDPAFFCADFFRQNYPETPQEYAVVNFRDASLDQYDANAAKCEQKIVEILTVLLEKTEYPIRLLPMHTFHVGGDDRDILNRLKIKLNSPRISVLNNPPSLVETMSQYRNASVAIGMRFHAVLLQTVLNGRNYIVDYTHPTKGKTIGLLREIGLEGAYNNRYYSLQAEKGNMKILAVTEKQEVPSEKIQSYQNIYITHLKAL